MKRREIYLDVEIAVAIQHAYAPLEELLNGVPAFAVREPNVLADP